MPRSHTSELVKARAALEKTRDRRTSVLPQPEWTEEGEFPKVEDPWQIACEEQLVDYATRHPHGLWTWIERIRLERDEFRGYTDRLQGLHDLYEDLDRKYKARNTSLLESQEEYNAAQEQILDLQARVIELQRHLRDANTKLLTQSDSDPDPQWDQERSSRKAKQKKSTKMPDPPVFTDGKDPTWDEWSAKIAEKMEANSDHYPDAKSKASYVLTRLAGDAGTYTFHRRGKGCTNPYQTFEEILEELAETYEDSDRLENSRRSLARLTMGERPFKHFIADFIRFAHASKFNDDHLIQLLKEKLPSRLLKPMLAAGALTKFESLVAVKNFLTKLDNSHLHDLPIRKQKAVRATTSRTTYDPTKARVPAEARLLRKHLEIKVPVCHQCGEAGHYKNKCTVAQQTPKGLKAAQDASIHEAQIAAAGHNGDDLENSSRSPTPDSSSGSEN